MDRGRTAAIFVGLLLVAAAGGPAPAAAQEDLVTLTVAVQTPGGDPVAHATLTAAWAGGSGSQTTAANGKAFVDVPAGADVTLSVAHADYVRNVPVEIRNATARDVDLTVYAKADAQVTVEGPDGPVANASVRFSKDGQQVRTATTGSQGVADSGTVEAGRYQVTVSKAGYYEARTTLDLSGTTRQTVHLRRGTVTLEANVTDDHFDPPKPVVGATVDVTGSGSIRTQPTGVGRVSVPVNAWTTVRVTKDGYESVSRQVFVAERDLGVDVAIQRTPALSAKLLSDRVVVGESVSLAVTDEYGEPVSGATVRLDGETVGQTDANGHAVLTIQSAGDHEIRASRGSLSTDAHTVTGVTAGSSATATATPETTQPSGGLRGFGVPVAVLAIVALLAAARFRRR